MEKSKMPLILISIILIVIIILFAANKAQNKTTNQSNMNSNQVSTPQQNIKNITKLQLQEILKQPQVQILDIRTPQEYAQGRLAKSQNIDFYQPDFADQLNKLDKNKTYLIYCRSGNRSGQAMEIMKKLNFTNVYNVQGGLSSIPSELLCTTC